MISVSTLNALKRPEMSHFLHHPDGKNESLGETIIIEGPKYHYEGGPEFTGHEP